MQRILNINTLYDADSHISVIKVTMAATNYFFALPPPPATWTLPTHDAS